MPNPTLNTDPLVSVVIPTRFRPDFVCKAVESALQQTYRNVEVLVVIDGPDPETETALRAISDPRLRVFALSENVGGSEARNIGAREGKGQFVAFLDDDDLWLPTKIASQKEAWEKSGYLNPIVFSSVIGRSPNEDYLWPRRFPRKNEPVADYLFCRKGGSYGDTLLQTSTIFASRQLLLDSPFLKGLKKHQDWDWLIHAAQHPGVGIVMVEEPLAIFHIGGQRQSVGRSADWEHSLQWAITNRKLMSGRAFSFFIAVECVPRASRSSASLGSYWRLLREFFFRGSPSPTSFFLFLVFWLVPQEKRQKAGRLLHRWKQKLSRANRNQTEFAKS
jgi:glycosyltransferase involved in cell wall biosynthesis